MELAVIGSRTFRNPDVLYRTLQPLDVSRIISGSAMAEQYASDHGVPFLYLLPDWKRHGKAAGVIRNREIVARADMVVAFWDGRSRETNLTIDIATAQGTPVRVIQF